MLIKVTVTKDEMEQIKKERSNHTHSSVDLEINIIDAIDAVLELPTYDVEINIEG